MLKTNTGSKASKQAKKSIITSFQSGSVLFIIQNSKESFQKLKQGVCKELIMQNFDISKLIRLETDKSRKAIRGVLYQ